MASRCPLFLGAKRKGCLKKQSAGQDGTGKTQREQLESTETLLQHGHFP